MTKTTICFAIILIAGVAMLKLIDVQVAPHTELPEVLARDQKMQDAFVKYYTFKDAFEATLTSLQRGEITLAEAHERVYHSAKRFNPDFFLHLTYSEKGTTDQERLARNLVGHARSTDEILQTNMHRTQQLDVELATMLKVMAPGH